MLTLRPLQDGDIETIAKLEQELFSSGAWSAAALEQEVHAPARYYLVATLEDTLVGYAGYWYDGEDAELMTIGVSKQFQGQAIGSQLLQQLLANAKQQGAWRMLLEVRVDNDPALKLYKNHGFTIMSVRKRYYQPEGIDAYTMSATLNEKRVGFQSQN